MKRFLFLTLIIGLFMTMKAQKITDSFLEKVDYIGAFDGSNDWTTGWTEWAPENADYPDPTLTKGNGVFDHDNGLHITSDETWSGVIQLDGWVFVDDGATLTIEAGTIVRSTAKSVLVIERGGMINAAGTSTSPIVFTSIQGPGLRSNSDWAGIVICGKGINNLGGGEGVAEGGIGSVYGGTDNTDNSGTLKYVRIEFPGYEVATGSEVNGLTLCSVGSGTTIDYIQVSNSGDDGYEWFGGAVNAKHLISYRTEDDDFDTDNGFAGMVQFGIAARDSSIVDTDTANGFESDNDAAGSSNDPKTNALFSNMTMVGPSETNTSPEILRTNHNEGSGMRIRRNSRLQVYNSVFLGWGRGLRLESEKGWVAAQGDTLTVQNVMLAGIRNDLFKTDVADGASAIESWFNNAIRSNGVLPLATDLKLADPFNYTARNFQVETGSPVLNASWWYKPVVTGPSIDNVFFEHVAYVGALDESNDWTTGWTEWAPEDAEYPEATITKGNGVFDHDNGLHITSDETWNGVIKLDGWVYVDEGATLTIEAGTIVRSTAKSVLVIERGGMINAAGTSTSPIVFTSNQGAGLRSNSDWAGIVLCGKGINNLGGGEGVAEGGIGSVYGGTDNTDNSGTMKYVRIEFPGYEVATGSEVNGLTFCSVGSGTTIDYIQVSNSGDDGYEWFGGAVNAKHLISYRTEDDDFDTDNGFVGMVQFGIAARDSSIVDTDTANGFESDNDAAGSSNSPKTNAVFSNMTMVGPSESNDSPATLRTNHNEGSGARIRRNSRLQIYNTLFLGFGRGLRLESEKGWTAAQADTLTVQYSILSGIRNDKFKTDVTDGAGALEAWYNAPARNNSIIESGADAMLADPFNYEGRNFLPETGSPVLKASYWYDPTGISSLKESSETLYCYPNPFNNIAYIDVTISEQTSLRASIYDLSGKLVRELYNGVAFPGTTTLEFDAGGLPKGIYIGQVATENQSFSVKMILK